MLRPEQRTDGVARWAHVPGELEATGLIRSATDMKSWHTVRRDHGPRRRLARAADRGACQSQSDGAPPRQQLESIWSRKTHHSF